MLRIVNENETLKAFEEDKELVDEFIQERYSHLSKELSEYTADFILYTSDDSPLFSETVFERANELLKAGFIDFKIENMNEVPGTKCAFI